jgi:hypothetical protein
MLDISDDHELFISSTGGGYRIRVDMERFGK